MLVVLAVLTAVAMLTVLLLSAPLLAQMALLALVKLDVGWEGTSGEDPAALPVGPCGTLWDPVGL